MIFIILIFDPQFRNPITASANFLRIGKEITIIIVFPNKSTVLARVLFPLSLQIDAEISESTDIAKAFRSISKKDISIPLDEIISSRGEIISSNEDSM